MAVDRDRLVSELRKSRKYRHLCDDILLWAATLAAERQPHDRTALKFAKRKLHQAFGSFVEDRKRLMGALARAAAAETDSAFMEALTDAIAAHASTAERLEDPGGLWRCVQSVAGPNPRLLDLGCGIAAATLPWSGWPADLHYVGIDLDAEVASALQGALDAHYPKVCLETGDVRQPQNWPEADVVILAKLLPTLERQQPGAAAQLVRQLDAPVVIATFPIRSLGGHDRGMLEQYTALADTVLGPGVTEVVPGELIRIVRR
ncbi:MAG: hypothetical protein AAGA48_14055 [Myxococcota bacterium]